MLPVPQPLFLAAQPSAGSGGAKRARRCELPQTFFMFVQGAAGIGNTIVGLMTVPSLHTFALNDDTRLQYHNLLASRNPVDMDNIACGSSLVPTSSWKAPQQLNSDEVNPSGALVAEMFTDAGSQKVKDLHVRVVPCCYKHS